MAKVHGVETLPKISIAWVGCSVARTLQTIDRQTDGRRHIARSRSLKISLCVCQWVSESVTQNEVNALQIAIFHRCSPNFPRRCGYLLFLVEFQNISVPNIPPKPLFGENLQLKPVKSISAYFLTTDNAIVTKLDQTIKEIELYKKLEFGDKGVKPGSRDLLLEFWDPLHISGTVETRNFKFGSQIGHWGY